MLGKAIKVTPSWLNQTSEEIFRHKHQIEWLTKRIEKLEKKQKG